MKKIIPIILCALFVSCSSSKVEKQIVHDFLNKESKTKYIEVLVEEALSKTKALQYYENAYNDKNLYEGEIRFAPNGYPPYNWEIDTVEIAALKRKYEKDTMIYHWKKSDFIKPKFTILKYKSLRRPENKKYEFGYGMYLSKPLITSDKKHAFLFYRFFGVGIGFSNEKAVLLKKANGKWIELYHYNNIKEIN